ncbi:hypothetical protein TB1_034314 [Malus domestica]
MLCLPSPSPLQLLRRPNNDRLRISTALNIISNYDNTVKKTIGGRKGYSAKLMNIFSTEFIIETADGMRQKKYKQAISNRFGQRVIGLKIARNDTKTVANRGIGQRARGPHRTKNGKTGQPTSPGPIQLFECNSYLAR